MVSPPDPLAVSIFELIGKEPPAPEVVNRTFDLFLHALNNKIAQVHRVKNLYYPGTVKEWTLIGYSADRIKLPLWGLQMTDRIYINHNADKEGAIRILIHELLHFLFEFADHQKEEKAVTEIERRLWRRFSHAQIEILWQYVPRKVTLTIVDHEPKK